MTEVKSTPDPSERVVVVIYDTTTGFIKQRSHVFAADAQRQHVNHAGCAYLDVTDTNPDCSPADHMVDLATKTIVPRVAPTDWDKAVKLSEIHAAHRDAVLPDFDLTEVQLKFALGDKDAIATAQAHLKVRADATAKRDALLANVGKATTKDALTAIKWGKS